MITGSCWSALTMRRRCDGEVDHQREQHLARTRAGSARPRRRRAPTSSCARSSSIDGDDDLVLGLELVVDRGLRDADGVGDHLERGPAHPVPAEQVERGGDDPGLRRAPVRTSAAGRSSTGSSALTRRG